MKRTQILGSLGVLALSCFPAAALVRCAAIDLRANAEVGESGVSLADLLTAESCPALRRAAAAVRLGDAPQPGIARVFDGDEIRRALHQLTLTLSGPRAEATADVHPSDRIVPERIRPERIRPERIMVRRAGPKASCGEIGEFVARALRSRMRVDGFSAAAQEITLAQPLPGRELDCGKAGRIPRDAPLELMRVFWDPALQGWEYSLRCVHPSDCVPFLVRQVPAESGPGAASRTASDLRFTKNQPQPANAPLAVQVGQTATLFWEQDGIRAVLPVTCLDRGAVGSLVRARTKNGNRILRAEVVSAGILRAAL
jgi:Chaperone for flagella basal body P-ring formation